MKNLILLSGVIVTVIISAIFSCSIDEGKEISTTYPQKWKLVKMSGNMQSSEVTGDAMDWQEEYIFKKDNTFIKRRENNNKATEAKGVFFTTSLEDGDYLELTFLENDKLAGSCSTEPKELLKLEKNKLSNTWLACDGPGLEYRKID
ncbi:MAG: hypothetical protein ACNS60_10290 [Candidatus Cyclobacteriaceae bacterium M2_1C_046]